MYPYVSTGASNADNPNLQECFYTFSTSTKQCSHNGIGMRHLDACEPTPLPVVECLECGQVFTLDDYVAATRPMAPYRPELFQCEGDHVMEDNTCLRCGLYVDEPPVPGLEDVPPADRLVGRDIAEFEAAMTCKDGPFCFRGDGTPCAATMLASCYSLLRQGGKHVGINMALLLPLRCWASVQCLSTFT